MVFDDSWLTMLDQQPSCRTVINQSGRPRRIVYTVTLPARWRRQIQRFTICRLVERVFFDIVDAATNKYTHAD
jgi:hypothetical protein